MANTCQLLSNYVNTIIQETKTQSNATFIRAQKAGVPAILKISFDYHDKSNRIIHREDVLAFGIDRIRNSLIIEISIYHHINKILNNNYTPHLVRMLDYIHCDNFTTVSKTMKFGAWPQLLAKISSLMKTDKLLNYDSSNILCLEYVQAVNFRQWLDSQQWTINDLKVVIFQVLYTLAVFNDYGIQHNDLHQGNILVERFQAPVTRYYNIHGRMYKTTSSYNVKIYDFDNATLFNSTYNKECDYLNTGLGEITNNQSACFQLGRCNIRLSKFDLFIFLSQAYHVIKNMPNIEAKQFIESLAARHVRDPNLLVFKGTYDLCNYTNGKPACAGPYTEQMDRNVDTVNDILRGTFEQFTSSDNPQTFYNLPSNIPNTFTINNAQVPIVPFNFISSLLQSKQIKNVYYMPKLQSLLGDQLIPVRSTLNMLLVFITTSDQIAISHVKYDASTNQIYPPS